MICVEHIVNPLLDSHNTKRDNPLLIEDNPLMLGRRDMGVIISCKLRVSLTRPLGTCIWNAADDCADEDPDRCLGVRHYIVPVNSMLPIVAIRSRSMSHRANNISLVPSSRESGTGDLKHPETGALTNRE
jgi:hypothetical protein